MQRSPWSLVPYSLEYLERLKRGPAGATPMVSPQDPFEVPAIDEAALKKVWSLPPAPKGSGKTNTGSLEGNQKVQRTEVSAKWPEAEEIKRIAEALRGLPELEALRNSKESLQNLAAMGMVSGEPQLDLSPLMALTDSQTGSKLMAGYTRPEGPAAAFSRALGVANAGLDADKDVAKSLLDAVGKFKSGTVNEQLLRDLAIKFQGQNSDPNKTQSGGTGRPDMLADKYLKTFMSIPEVKDANMAAGAAREMTSALKKPNWLTDSTLRSSLVTAAKLYPVSNLDIQQYGGSPNLGDMINRLVQRLATDGGRFLPSDRKVIEEYAKLQAKKAAAVTKKKREEYTRSMAPEYGYTYDRGFGILAPAITDPSFGVPEDKPAPVPPSFMDILKKMREEDAAKKGK